MTSRDWVLLVCSSILLLVGAVLAGITADRLILHTVPNGPPQRLAAAMGGLFVGGLIFFAGVIAWVVRRPE